MDVNSRFSISPTRLFIFLLVLFDLENSNTVNADGPSGAGIDGAGQCGGDMSSFLPLPYGKLQNMVCKRLWNTFVLRYSQTEGNVVTIVVSAIYTSGWVGIGFSKDGMMLNSSCMVGWVNLEGRAKIKQYYVEGFTPSAVKPDKGELPLTNVPPYVALNGASIYLAFQLKYPVPLKRQPILLAYSTVYPKHHHLSLHDDKTTINFDFSSGNYLNSAPSSSAGTFYRVDGMKKTHGVLSVMGWGLFLPYGAIVARYLRHRDPLWYYIHVVIEFLGFVLGVAAAVVGLSLDRRLQLHSIVGHKTIGIFVLVFSILQVMAFFARPSKDSKNRKYWNWYHSWSGRIAIFLASVNIILGIHIADAGKGWKIGYGILLSLTLIACMLLETLSRLKRRHDHREFPPQAFQMNGM